jgi:hypothetical protein
MWIHVEYVGTYKYPQWRDTGSFVRSQENSYVHMFLTHVFGDEMSKYIIEEIRLSTVL